MQQRLLSTITSVPALPQHPSLLTCAHILPLRMCALECTQCCHLLLLVFCVQLGLEATGLILWTDNATSVLQIRRAASCFPARLVLPG